MVYMVLDIKKKYEFLFKIKKISYFYQLLLLLLFSC